MSEERVRNVASDLKGMAVLERDTGDKLGDVSDAIVHPTDGRVLGILVRTPEGEGRVVATPDLVIGKDAIMVTGGPRTAHDDAQRILAAGIPASGELVGTNVVTEDGTLLGRVSEVYICAARPPAAYRVTGSTLQRFFGGGFFLAGNAVRSYSRDGVRMIVPANAEDRHAASSLAEALGGGQASEGVH